MGKLQNKIFLFFAVLLTLVQAITLIVLYQSVEAQKWQRIENRLQAARTSFQNQFETRSYYLGAFADTVARDYGLKQVFTDDVRSLLVALNNHRGRIDADLAMVVTAAGEIKAQLVVEPGKNERKARIGKHQSKQFPHKNWLRDTQLSRLYVQDGNIFQLRFSPVKNGDFILGWVGFGYSIDERLAQRFHDTTGLDTAFVFQSDVGSRIIASSSAHHHDWLREFNGNAQAGFAEDLLITRQSLGNTESGELYAVLYGERSHLLKSAQENWRTLVFVVSVMLLASSLVAYWIAANITRPVKQLVRQVREIARGNYNLSVELNSNDEIGLLAHEFEQMKCAVKSREETIQFQASHDSLTALPNRQLLLNALSQLIENRDPFALLILAPNGMNDINYSLGYGTGDALIQEISQRLVSLFGRDACFNTGGSNFAVLAVGPDKGRLTELLQLLYRDVARKFESSKLTLQIHLHIGITLYPEHGDDANELIQRAGSALQSAQRDNTPQVYYDASLTDQLMERLQLINGFRQAIEEDQLQLYYQPKYDFRRECVVGVEALIRWFHPEKGMIPPDKFIPLAEQTGYIHELTLWIVETALRQYRAWQNEGFTLPVALNISAENFCRPGFFDCVFGLVTKYEQSHRAIALEVTESVVARNADAAIELLQKFRDHGFRISVDDYGTGYSSLDQLKRMPVSEMKIDKSFVQNMLRDHRDRVIVASTIELAHSLDLEVVAEGIEDRPTLEWLAWHGCDLAQGYYISKPQPAEQLATWMHHAFVYPRGPAGRKHA